MNGENRKLNKYNARKTVVDDIIFHSMAEANRYKILKILERAGEITNLSCQVPFSFVYKGKKIFTYFADFTYNSNKGYVIEDVKGVPTPVYKLKKKLIEIHYEIIINEIN